MIYRIQNQRVILCGRKRLVSSPTSHTHFPGRPDGFPNISSPSPPDLGVKGTSLVACSSKAIGGRRPGPGEGGDGLRSGGEVCWKSPAQNSRRRFKDAFPVLIWSQEVGGAGPASGEADQRQLC